MHHFPHTPLIAELEAAEQTRRQWRVPLSLPPPVVICVAAPPGLPNLVLQSHFAAQLTGQQGLRTLLTTSRAGAYEQMKARFRARNQDSQQLSAYVTGRRFNWRAPAKGLSSALESFVTRHGRAPEALLIDAGPLSHAVNDAHVEAAHLELLQQCPGASVVMVFVEVRGRMRNPSERIPAALWVLPTLFLAAPVTTRPDNSAGTFALLRMKSDEYASNRGGIFQIRQVLPPVPEVYDLAMGPVTEGDPMQIIRAAEGGGLCPYLQNGIRAAIWLLQAWGPLNCEEIKAAAKTNWDLAPTSMRDSLSAAFKAGMLERRPVNGGWLWKLPEQSFYSRVVPPWAVHAWQVASANARPPSLT